MSKQVERDRELLKYWLQKREDAERAIETANRQIEYLSMYIIMHSLDELEPDGEGTTDTKME